MAQPHSDASALTVAPLSIRLLGGFELRLRDGEVLPLATRKAEALLAMLALRPGRALARDKLCGLLWPEVREAQARHSLRQTLLCVRKALPPAALSSDSRTLTLDERLVEVDVASIERRLLAGSRVELLEAASLYRGDFLDGISIDEQPFEQWLTLERERLRGLMTAGLARLIDLHTLAGELPEAIQACLRLLQLEPLHEETHRALMRLHARQGRRASALQVYQNLARTLRAELGTEPDPETRAQYDELQQAALVQSAPAPDVPRPAANEATYTAGRSSELSELRAALERGWQSSAEVYLLAGEAGVGKTHLCERLAEYARQRGARVLRGRCFESEQVLPFASWSNLLGSAGLREDSTLLRDLRALPAELRAELSVLLPDSDMQRPTGPSQDVLRLFKAVQRALRLLVEPAPLLLILEDLHWADEMSLRLLCFLVRRQAGSAGCFVVGSLREEELSASSFLHTAAAELERERLLRRVQLAPLSRVDSLLLAQHAADSLQLERLEESVLEQLWSLSEGNPLVIVESARSLAQGAPADDARLPAAGLQLPERIRALIRSRVLRVSPAARELLAFAAVAGRELDLPVLISAGRPQAPLMAALEELLERQLMRAHDDRVYFTHDRIRETLYRELSPARRRLLHAEVAEALERRFAGHLEPVLGHIGYHHSNAGNAEQAVKFLMRFAERARRGHGTGEALAALERAALDSARLPSADRTRIGIEILTRQAFCLAFLGRFRDLIARVSEQRERLDALADPALAGPFYFWWGFACTLLAERREAEEHARSALAHAERAGDKRAMGYAHTLLSYLCAVTGRCEEGLRHGAIAIEILSGTTLDPDALTLAICNQGLNHLWLGNWPEALLAVQKAEAVADASESQRCRALAATSLAYAYGYVQQWPLAIETARRALGASTEPMTLAHAMWISGYVQAGGGEPRQAAALLEVVIERHAHHGMRAQSGHARVALAAALLRANEASRALTILVDALEISRAVNDLPGIGSALRVRGEAELHLQRWAEARASLDEALAVFGSYGSRIDLAHTFVVRAELARARGDGGEAQAGLAQARSLYLECGVGVGAEDQIPPFDA